MHVYLNLKISLIDEGLNYVRRVIVITLLQLRWIAAETLDRQIVDIMMRFIRYYYTPRYAAF